jgi:hypothetical protein
VSQTLEARGTRPSRQIAHVTARAGKVRATPRKDKGKVADRAGNCCPSTVNMTTPSTTVVSAVVILMVIQTIQLALSKPNRTDDAPHVTSLDPTGANQSDTEHSPTDLAVVGHRGSGAAGGTAVTQVRASA